MSNKKYKIHNPRIVKPVLVETIVEPGLCSKSYILLFDQDSKSESDVYFTYTATITELANSFYDNVNHQNVKPEKKYFSAFGKMLDSRVPERVNMTGLRVASVSDISDFVNLLTKNDYFAKDLATLRNLKAINVYYKKSKK